MNVFSNKSPQIDCPGNLPDNIITNSRQNANNFDLYPVLFFEQLQKSCLLFFQIVDKTTKYEKKRRQMPFYHSFLQSILQHFLYFTLVLPWF